MRAAIAFFYSIGINVATRLFVSSALAGNEVLSHAGMESSTWGRHFTALRKHQSRRSKPKFSEWLNSDKLILALQFFG